MIGMVIRIGQANFRKKLVKMSCSESSVFKTHILRLSKIQMIRLTILSWKECEMKKNEPPPLAPFIGNARDDVSVPIGLMKFSITAQSFSLCLQALTFLGSSADTIIQLRISVAHKQGWENMQSMASGILFQSLKDSSAQGHVTGKEHGGVLIAALKYPLSNA